MSYNISPFIKIILRNTNKWNNIRLWFLFIHDIRYHVNSKQIPLHIHIWEKITAQPSFVYSVRNRQFDSSNLNNVLYLAHWRWPHEHVNITKWSTEIWELLSKSGISLYYWHYPIYNNLIAIIIISKTCFVRYQVI